MHRNIALLGSTGSIGKNTLEVVRNNSDKLKIISLTAGKNWKLLAEQALEFRPLFVALADKQHENDLKNVLKGSGIKIGVGEEALIEAVSFKEIDTVLAAIVGFAGLKPTMQAVNLGKRICLANKETLVVAGSLFIDAVEKNKVSLLPVDSEHSAIFQCLGGLKNDLMKRIIITASGGPFRDFPNEELKNVTVEMALKHPNWNMGGKITIDSSTLMNKGLEIIEAHWLFGASYDEIDVVVHPQSLIHSMVEFKDGSVIAQMGVPDMKLPIQCALSWPDRWNPPVQKLDLVKAGTMSFYEPRYDDFPCIKLAIEAGRSGGIMPCVLNAANEVAVYAFMKKEIGFLEIPELVKQTLREFKNVKVESIDQLIQVDLLARKKAAEFINIR